MGDRGRGGGRRRDDRGGGGGQRSAAGGGASRMIANADDRPARRDNDRRGGGGGNDRSRRDNDHHNNSAQSQQSNPRSLFSGMRQGGGGAGQGIFAGRSLTETDLLAEMPKKKFTGRCRLFVGNMPNDVKEDELKELFAAHGEISECFLSGKGFAFLRMDTRAHAESAKEAIDGKLIKGRPIRVRFAVHGASVRVKELSPVVSNEMLYHAFSVFGEVERAVHIVDEKGRPTGEGIVEFERKPSANDAIQQTRDNVFLLTSNPKPVVVEPLEPRDEDDGLSERMVPRNQQLMKEREAGPRFASPNSFELVFGRRWKEVYDLERARRAQLDAELKEARMRLEADMELAYQDYQTQLLREDLERRQQELERLEAAKRDRMARRGDEPGLGGIMGMRAGMGGQMGRAEPFFGGGAPRGQFGSSLFNGNPGGGGGMDGPFGRGGAPFMGGGPSPPRMGAPFGGGPGGGQGPDPNLVQGVQKLLQIFKNDPNDQHRQQQQGQVFGGGVGGQPMGNSPGPFAGNPGMMGGGGAPSPFGGRAPSGGGGYPPDKRPRHH